MEDYKTYKNGDILIIIDFGGGINPDDVGKKLKFLSTKPEGNISNNFNNYDIYFEYLPMIQYTTKDNPKQIYGKCSKRMVKKATPEVINDYSIF